MKIRFTFLIIFLFLTTIAGAQPKTDPIILIKGKSSVHSGTGRNEFFISIGQTKKDCKLVYGLKDTLLFRNLLSDRNNAWITDKLPINPSEITNSLFDSMMVLMEKYTVYQKDSIEFNLKKNKKFLALFDSVIKASDEELQEKEKRFILDGTSFTITIQSGGKTRKIYANSPTAKSHPLLRQLIDESLILYRQSHPETVFNQKNMFGY